MARKKAVTEPREEQMQDAAVPVEGMGGEGGGPAPDVPMDNGDGSAPFPDGDGAADTTPGGFPAADDTPFDGSGSDMPEEGAGGAPMEPSGEDGIPHDGEGEAPGETETDYAAFLDAVGQGGTEPIDPPPLMLGGDEGGADDGPDELPPMPPEDSGGNLLSDGETSSREKPDASRAAPTRTIDRRPLLRRERDRVLTIDPRAEVLTREDQEALVWHELENANRTKQILTGKLSATERTPAGMDVAIIMFKGTRVLIPLQEMGVHTGPVPSDPDYAAWAVDIVKIVNSRQQSDVDFVVRGIDYDGMTVVGSRRDAMRRKRKRFYLDTDEQGRHMIEEGSRVQARVVSVMEKSLRVEVFGVECMVSASGVSRLWVSSLRDKFNVGDLVVVRVTKIEQTADGIEIRVDARDIFGEDGDNLSQCQQWGRYVGQVTDVHNGRFFIRLDIGVNALSHECRDMRMPGRKDIVSLTVTRLDEKNGVALGIINRIIKQNL